MVIPAKVRASTAAADSQAGRRRLSDIDEPHDSEIPMRVDGSSVGAPQPSRSPRVEGVATEYGFTNSLRQPRCPHGKDHPKGLSRTSHLNPTVKNPFRLNSHRRACTGTMATAGKANRVGPGPGLLDTQRRWTPHLVGAGSTSVRRGG